MAIDRFFALTGPPCCSDKFSPLAPILFDFLLGLLTRLLRVCCRLLARFLSRLLAQVFYRLLAWVFASLLDLLLERVLPCFLARLLTLFLARHLARIFGRLLPRWLIDSLVDWSWLLGFWLGFFPELLLGNFTIFFRAFYSLRGVRRQCWLVLARDRPLLALAELPGSRFCSFSPDILVRLFLYTLRSLLKL